MNKNLKYLMLTMHVHSKLLEENPKRGGLYQWPLGIFPSDEGSIQLPYHYMDKLEDYDVIHINLSIGDIPLAGNIISKLKDSDTKVVLNTDYSIELLWGLNPNVHPDTFIREIKDADLIFSTEKYNASYLSSLLDNRRIPIIPHPCDVDFLKRVIPAQPRKEIDILCHFYNPFSTLTIHPNVINAILKDFDKIGYKKCLAGYQEQGDPCNWMTKYFFDSSIPYCTYGQYIGEIRQSALVFEPTFMHSHGRSVIDTAALGIPTFGSSNVSSMQKLWPNTCGDVFDVAEMRNIALKLVEDKKFKNEVVDYAKEHCDYYNLKNSRERFIRELDLIKK